MRQLLAALTLALAGTCRGQAPGLAIFDEPGFPYYIATPDTGPAFLAHCLTAAGLGFERLNAGQLADGSHLNPARVAALVYPYGNTFPHAALANLRTFRAGGGAVIAVGGVPFCHPCEREDGKWVDRIADLGWEFVSHRQLGTCLWGQAEKATALVHAAGDPLGLAWLGLPAAPKGIVQFPRPDCDEAASRVLGSDHALGLPAADRLIPVVSLLRDGVAVGHPVSIIEHHCAEFAGAIDIWLGTTLGPVLSLQQQRQLVVAACAYGLERKGLLTPERRAEILRRERAGYVPPNTAATAPARPFVHRSPPAATHLVVLDAAMLDDDERLLALSLQGLVNRREPRIWLHGDPRDRQWLDRILGAGRQAEECENLGELLTRFASEFDGAVVYDPARPWTVNTATMLAAVRGALIASPRLVAAHSLRVAEDLGGRFAGHSEANEWALANLWDKLDHRGVACMEPDWGAPRDYLVQHRLFTFWVDCAAAAAMAPRDATFLEQLLARLPVPAPVYGWWQQGDDAGIGEWRGVTVSSKFGKVTVCTVGAWNLSLHSGLPLPEHLTQRRVAAGSLERKVYVTFLVSDGDNFGMNLYPIFGRLWEQPMRGRVPVGWCLCPTQVELTPAAVDYWYTSAAANDSFVAMDGLGYIYPDVYGCALGPTRDWLRDFCQFTRPYMEQLDLRHLWYLSGTARAPDLTQALGVDGLFGEYGVTPQPRQELLGDTVAVWADTNPWEKPYDRVETYVERIRARIPAERPAFLMVGVNGFHIGPNEVAAVLRELGPDVVAVAPAEFCDLVRRFRTAGLDPNPAPRPALDLTPPPVRAPGLHREGDAWVLRESEGEPDVSGWWTAPQGTPWVRKRLDLSLPAGVTTATVRAFVQGKAGRRVGFRINGHEHSVTLRSSHWGWVSVTVPVAELVSGPNEVWYSGNPDGRLLIGGHSGSGPGHSDFGGPTTWHPLAGELACVLELR